MRDDRKLDYMFLRWAALVKQRDNFTCQICDRRGTELNSHHKNSWDVYEEERYDIDNGVSLCADCHKQFHDLYGYGNNTEIQFEEYRMISETLIKISEKKCETDKISKEVLLCLDGYVLGDGYSD